MPRRSSSTSSVDRTSRAPLRINSRQPALAGLSALPGTANTSRPCSAAWVAVISAPLRAFASTTTTARHRPLMIRLRAGNMPGCGSTVIGVSVTSAPCPATRSARSACSGG